MKSFFDTIANFVPKIIIFRKNKKEIVIFNQKSHIFSFIQTLQWRDFTNLIFLRNKVYTILFMKRVLVRYQSFIDICIMYYKSWLFMIVKFTFMKPYIAKY